MKVTLPIFKDEDAKDAVIYQSWRWDLTVYHPVGWRDCTCLHMPSSLCKVILEN